MAGIKAKMKVSDLRRALKALSQKELIDIIIKSYQSSDDIKELLLMTFNADEALEELFKKYKTQIKDEFFPERGFGKLRLSQAKKAISSFKKITGDEGLTFELMLYYVEQGVDFTNTYGDIDERFYNSMLSMYEKVIEQCNKNEDLFKAYKERLEAIVIDTEGIGWGFHDALEYLYYSIEWGEEEE
ncbi:DNA repair protein RadC [Pullulanibacillus pueri]|uniref:Uncharacterized protein n=1 Tax=Pullulanibacillus pueri TaxID=1437324 RepID=A0A8J2ZVJ7_9BACL|nr:DUF6155 family protein [Pullulanibacillus pueri]MBM7682366.1 DNA repair protein RadC [Pullulanibacillus pueri]GGH80630.1 hypothetical protein GCM10007096_17320 [Pullulanibacillus pueri]